MTYPAFRSSRRLLLLLLLVAGCSRMQPPPAAYILQSPASLPVSSPEPRPILRVENIRIAPYLDQSGLVIEAPPGQITHTRQHLWGEPIKEGIRRHLSRTLAQRMPRFQVLELRLPGTHSAAFLLHVEFDRFHAEGFETARMSGQWTLTRYPDGSIVDHRYFDHSAPLAGVSYPAIPLALSSLLETLSEEIATSVSSPAETN